MFEKSYPLGYYSISGYGRPNFKLYEEDEEVTYEQWKEFQKKYEDEQAKRKASTWAEPAIELCKEQKIMSGDASGSFRPQSHITRQEVAQVMMNLLRRAEK